MEVKFSVLLVGLGKIGLGNTKKSMFPCEPTHFDSITSNGNFRIIAGVDSKSKVENSILDNIPVFSTISQLPIKKFDLVTICSNTSSHDEILTQALLHLDCKVYLLEKPVGTNIGTIEKVKKLGLKKTQFIVNYQRNFNPNILESLSNFNNHKLQKGTVHYSNGSLNCASHAIALIVRFFGKPKKVKAIGPANYLGIDKGYDVDFYLEYGDNRIYFVVTNEKFYSNFRIEFDFESAIWSYDSSLSEIRVNHVPNRNDLKKENITEKNVEVSDTNENDSFNYVYDVIVSHLVNKSTGLKFESNLNLAHTVHQVLSQLEESIQDISRKKW